MTTFGLIIPQRAALFGVATLPELLALAPVAESSGLIDTVWVGDSLTSKTRADSLACLGALAGMTRQVKLAVGCMASFPIRDPALFAYQWASLDQVSGGRMLLAVCNGLQKRDGASEKEGRHFGGVPDKERAPRLEEYMDLVRLLWSGEIISFDGRFAQYEDLQIGTVPVQQPCPMWISANPSGPNAAKVLRRVATKSDGLLTLQYGPRYISGVRKQLDAELVEAGRSVENFPVAAYHSVNIGDDAEACLDEASSFFDAYYGPGMFDRDAARSICAVGTVDACVDQLHALAAEGVTHIALRLASWRQQEQLDLLLDKVLPAFAS